MATVEITLEHIRKAALWAQQARETSCPIDGETRKYDQSLWDCGTSCCMWGAASLMAGAGKASAPPADEWRKDPLHTAVYGLLCSSTATPEMMIALLDRGDLRGANLSEANLSEANLSGAYQWMGNRKVRLEAVDA